MTQVISTIKVLSATQYRRFPLIQSFALIKATIRSQFNIPNSQVLVITATDANGQTNNIAGQEDFNNILQGLQNSSTAHNSLILGIEVKDDIFGKKPLLPAIAPALSTNEMNELLTTAHNMMDSYPLTLADEIMYDIKTSASPKQKLQSLQDTELYLQTKILGNSVVAMNVFDTLAAVEPKITMSTQCNYTTTVDIATQTEKSMFKTTTRATNTPTIMSIDTGAQAGTSSTTSRPTNTGTPTCETVATQVEYPVTAQPISNSKPTSHPRIRSREINSFITPGRLSTYKRNPTEMNSLMLGSKPVVEVNARRSVTELSSFMTPGRMVNVRRSPRDMASLMVPKKVVVVSRRQPSELNSFMHGTKPIIKVQARRSTSEMSSFMTIGRIIKSHRSPQLMPSVMLANQVQPRIVKRSAGTMNSFMTSERPVVKRSVAQVNSFVSFDEVEDLEATIIGNSEPIEFDLSESTINWTTFGNETTVSYAAALNSLMVDDFELVEANDVICC